MLWSFSRKLRHFKAVRIIPCSRLAWQLRDDREYTEGRYPTCQKKTSRLQRHF